MNIFALYIWLKGKEKVAHGGGTFVKALKLTLF